MNKRCYMGCLLALFLVLVGASAHMLSDSQSTENVEGIEDLAGSENTEESEDLADSEDMEEIEEFADSEYVILETENSETVIGEESNSQKWNNSDCNEAISRYARKYQLEFKVADKELEDRIYGVWQAQKIVGWDKEDNDHGSKSLLGEIYIFSQEAFIERWPEFRPVYFYHTVRLEDLSSEDILNVSWEKNYEKQEAVFVIGIDVEGYEDTVTEDEDSHVVTAATVSGDEYNHVVKFFLLGDKLVLQSYMNDYYEMEKVAEVEIPEGILDIR